MIRMLGPVWRLPINSRSLFVELGVSPTLLGGSSFNGRDMRENFHFTPSTDLTFYLYSVYTRLMAKRTLIQKLSSDVADVCACRKMREASRKITRMYDEVLRPAGIKANQFNMLGVVALKNEATLTELAETLGMERTTLSRNLRPLERNGLVEVSAEGYRRARSANITNKGIAVMEKALPLWRSAQNSLKRRLGDETWDRIQIDLTEIGHLL